MFTSELFPGIRWLRPLMDLVYPRSCLLCAKPIIDFDQESICGRCDSQIVPTTHGCLRCSAPLPANQRQDAKTCFYCRSRKWSFRHAYCYTVYSGLAARGARQIKQPTCESLAIALGHRVGKWLTHVEHFDRSQYDCVVPIPQHWFRRVTVRYNQADVLAENIAKALSLPVERNWLFRTRWTEKQGTKTISERRTSVVNSFGCHSKWEVQGIRILIVDDIVTSGATADDAARAMRKAGAKQIDVAAFARGVSARRQKSEKNSLAQPES